MAGRVNAVLSADNFFDDDLLIERDRLCPNGPFHAAGKMALGDVRTQIPETKHENAAKRLSSLGLSPGHPEEADAFIDGGNGRYLDNR
jgi:hypothetical protein